MVVAPLVPLLAPVAIEAGKLIATEVGKALEGKPSKKGKTAHSSNPGPDSRLICLCWDVRLPPERVRTLLEAVAGQEG